MPRPLGPLLWAMLVAALAIGLPGPLPVSAQATATPSRPLLTLADAVRLAVEYGNPAIEARESVLAAEINLRVARSAFRPKVTSDVMGNMGSAVLAGQTYGLNVSNKLPTGTELRATAGASSFQNQLGTYFASDVGFSISQPVLELFSPRFVRNEVTNAENQVRSATRRQVSANQLLSIEVAVAYYRIASQKQLVELAEAAAERARRLLDASQAKLAIGKVSRLDTLRAQQLAVEADLQIMDARASVRDAEDRLRLLVGKDDTFEFSVAPVVMPPVEQMSEAEAAGLALRNRAEIKDADQAVLDAENAVWIAGRRSWPQFNLGVSVKRQEVAPSLRDAFGLGGFRSAAFASASLPLDRTAASAARDLAEIELGQRTRARDMLRQTVAQNARSAVRQHERLRRGFELVETSVEQARQEARLALLRYERGLSNNLDVTVAEANLLAARARRAEFLGQLAVAGLRVRAAAAVLDPLADVR